MIIKLNSYVIHGITSKKIVVESSVAPGLAKFEIIGLADTAIKESKERIFKSLIENGFKIPPGNITINLAPAKIKKRGPLYDLPIILGVLLATKQITTIHDLDNLVIAGELSLDGKLREVEGVFISTLQNQEAKLNKLYLMPKENIRDFSSFPELKDKVFLADNLNIAINQLNQISPIMSIPQTLKEANNTNPVKFKAEHSRNILQEESNDFREVIGHDTAKLAIQLSVIAKLNILLVGPPGGGKSMLIKRIPSIVPKLSQDESLMVTRIHHACLRFAHGSKPVGLIKYPPFREVHNSVHTVSLIGGGKFPEPGEISLAHKGYLFLDELSEYRRDCLQNLRIPMESKRITINRVEGQVTYPCDFTLLACTNPCSCGYYGDAIKMCRCSKYMMQQFYSRLSGPILDRFDLIIFINQFDRKSISNNHLSSDQMKQKIYEALNRVPSIPNPFINKTIKEIFHSNPMIEKNLLVSLEKNLISFRKVKSILKTCYALQLYYGCKLNKKILFQAIEFCRNKFALVGQE